jgi:hypothetical protein
MMIPQLLLCIHHQIPLNLSPRISLLFLVLKKYDSFFSVFKSYSYQFSRYKFAGRLNFRRAKKSVSSDVGLLTRVPLDSQLSPNLAGRKLAKFWQPASNFLPCVLPPLEYFSLL